METGMQEISHQCLVDRLRLAQVSTATVHVCLLWQHALTVLCGWSFITDLFGASR